MSIAEQIGDRFGDVALAGCSAAHPLVPPTELGTEVTLVRVEPQPTSTAKIIPSNYRATLKIDRRGP